MSELIDHFHRPEGDSDSPLQTQKTYQICAFNVNSFLLQNP